MAGDVEPIAWSSRARRAGRRLRHAVRPLVRVVDPPPGIVVDRDVPVTVRDGTVLRVDVFRPEGDGAHPVLLCAHPYGRTTRPRPRRGRPGWTVPAQFRLLTQTEPFTISALTTWEAPDPGFWVPRGYAVVNADLRGWGTSEGTGELLARQEGRDGHDLVEWAGTRAWSNGRVGMTGVSYLAITQWATAAERPPHLAAINPWEGFTDVYRDFARPGGIAETGFSRLWSTALRHQHRSPAGLDRAARTRPLRDDWWRSHCPDVEAIEVPLLVCASFSDHLLHSRGSFEGFRRAGSTERRLHTHRGPKWASYYAGAGRAAQVEFFDHHLRGIDTGHDRRPPVRVEIRSDRRTVAEVVHTDQWPPADVVWRALPLDADAGRAGSPPTRPATAPVDRRRTARFVHVLTEPVDVVGPLWVRLAVALDEGIDAHCHVGVRLVRDVRPVGFEGSYGFGDDLLTHGMRRLALRARDPEGDGAAPPLPAYRDDRLDPILPGEVTPVDVELHASATRLRAGDELHLLVAGRWFFPTNPLTGQFPARYERPPPTPFRPHTGPHVDSALHLPLRLAPGDPAAGRGRSGRRAG